MGLTGLITKYGRDFTIVTPTAGTYDGGRFVAGTPIETPGRGAIIGVPLSRLNKEGGYYQQGDIYLYDISALPAGAQVRVDGRLYTATEERNYAMFAGFYKYLLRTVVPEGGA